MHWLRLIRWSNLLIIFLTQGVAWWCVILPLQQQFGVKLLLTPLNFFLLTTSTMLIAGAGYIINDYFDIRIDAINKPDSVILERVIPRRMAIIVHSVLNAIALVFAGIVAWQGGHLEWLLVQTMCTALLWRYSTTWKRQFMIGNVAVAVMTALTVVVLMVYEPGIRATFRNLQPMETSLDYLYPNSMVVLSAFALFAFVMTWTREIVKDMEDLKGDVAEGCVTMPIKWGLLASSRFVQMLIGLCVIALLISSASMWLDGLWIAGAYLICVVLGPICIWAYKLPKHADKNSYSIASRRIKLIMVAGILALPVIQFDIWYNNL